ncbi:hypothetical protein GOP47_0003576 [Adiantum capillus-veneris]|uniref:Pentatricopeptide repeat-containing protein n=1 Tax=Adiantum capillus-veneris TaxID=13818 RepID=A0A9D4ZLT2_ADICA|nr:hypothetical protein GOP47_0003576 [Adiantum capillus-veneris]
MVPKPEVPSIRELLAKELRCVVPQEKLKVLIDDKAVLRWCAVSNSLSDGQSVHDHITKTGLSWCGFLQNLLVQMYGNCGELETAFCVFAGMHKRDVFSFSFMIKTYVQQGHGSFALELFDQMQQEGILPDRVLLMNVLPACTNTAESDKLLVRLVGSDNELDLLVGTSLVKLFGKYGQVECAREVFNSTVDKDTVLWTAMIAVYAQKKLTKNALILFSEMSLTGIDPDDVTFLSVLSACASQGYLIDGMSVHAFIVDTGLESSTSLMNALLNLYSKCNALSEVHHLFRSMDELEAASWTAIIAAYAHHGLITHTIQAFDQMHQEGALGNKLIYMSVFGVCDIPQLLRVGATMHARAASFDLPLDATSPLDVVMCNALITMYGKCGSVNQAFKVLQDMPEKDVISWNSIIQVFTNHEHDKEALQIYKQMLNEGTLPDAISFVQVLEALSSPSAMKEGKQTHVSLLSVGLVCNVVVATSLLNMYKNCGSLKRASLLFHEMCERDIVAWNAFIEANTDNSGGKVALQMYEQMQQEAVLPEQPTHAGLIREASKFLTSMEEDYALKPDVEHHNCMIDLLGRAGCLEEAENWMKKMSVEPTSVSWLILLNACKQYVDVERGEDAAEHIFRMDPEDVTPYVLLSNLYAGAGMEEDAAGTIRRMLDKGLKLQPGHPLLKAC